MVGLSRRNPKVWKYLRSSRRNRRSDFDVRPMMNLFMILVPFLLMYTSFVEISILHSAVVQSATEGPGTDQPKLALTVDITPGGFRMHSMHYDLKKLVDEQIIKPGKSTITVARSETRLFTDILKKIKASFPSETEITLVPMRQHSYQEIIQVMDLVNPQFSNIAFSQPTSEGEQKKP